MVSGHPDSARIAEVVVEGADGGRRGSGYLVADGWVLTACHVVTGAARVAVWLGAPASLGSEGRLDVDLTSVLADEGSDLALLPVAAGAEGPVEPVLFARLDRDAAVPVPVVAAGCPRFKLRPGPTPGKLLREVHEAHGTVAVRSNEKTRAYEMAGLVVIPEEDPEPDLHSPWEGMSGAAVWADQRLIGIVAQHHPGDGRGTITVRPLEALFQEPADRVARWREALGPRLPVRPSELWLVRRAAPGETEVDLAREVAMSLAPPELLERDAVLAELDFRLACGERWCWVRGEAFAGKTALLAWLVTHPPPNVALASCFLRSTTTANTADYALSTLTGQLAALTDRADYHPARFLPEKRAQFGELLAAASRACRERGHRLVLLVDGLDEYEGRDSPLRDWLVGEGDLPADAALLAASRSGVELDLPAGHPLRVHVLPLAKTDTTVELHTLAMEELRRALAERIRLEYAVVGLVAVADGGLTVTDLRAMLRRMGISAFVPEITDTLDTALRRTITPVPGTAGRATYAFAHVALKDAARAKFAEEGLAEFDATLLGWCNDFRDAGWPQDTPDYVLSHYPRHLHSAGRPDDLVAILEDRAWYQRNEACDPSAATYLAGVHLAWRAAEELDEERARSGQVAARLGAEIRACLIVSSVASRSTRIGVPLLSVLVSSGVWSTRRAFDVARLTPAAEERAELLIALAGEGPDDDLRDDVVRTAVAATAGIVDEMRRAWIWEKLAPLVPAALLDDALLLAGSLPPRLPDHRRPRVIAEAALLARAAAAGLPDRALDAIRAMRNGTDRARALAEVAGALPADRTGEALALVRDLRWDSDQAEPLTALAVATLESQGDGEALLREAFDVALGLASPGDSLWVLRRLACVLPEAWVREALDALRVRLKHRDRGMCVTALAARLAVLGQWAAALEVVREFNENVGVRGLAAIAQYAPESDKPALAAEMLDSVQKIDRIFMPHELAGVAPHLTEPVLRRALDWADSIDKEDGTAAARELLPRLADLGHVQEAYDRALAGQEVGRYLDRVPGIAAWAGLIPHLPEPLRTQGCHEALRLAMSINDVRERILACISQAGALGEEEVGDLLRSLEAVDGFARGYALRKLVPHLPDFLLPKAVDFSLTVDTTERFAGAAVRSPRAAVLIELAPRLQGALRNRALETARAAVAEIDAATERNEATLRAAVAFSAPDVATAEARESVARRIRDYQLYDLARAVGPVLPADLVQEVEAERQAADARRAERVNSLLAPGPRLEDQERDRFALYAAFDAARGISDQELRGQALSRLAPHVTVLLERRDSDETEDDWINSRAAVLTALARYLGHDQLPAALDAALDLLTKGLMAPWSVLAAFSGPLGTLPRDRLYPLWRRILHALAPLHRKDTLGHLSALGPVVTALGGQAAAGEFVRAVDEIGQWWP